MKLFRCLLLCLIAFVTPIHAQNAALVIGVESFIPPFVSQDANNNLYGFDITLMTELCKIMNRTCQFKVMRFEQLLPAVANKEIDVAISAITITHDRSKLVDFSLPYLLSYSRFLTNQTTAEGKTFNLDLFTNKKIGIGASTVFRDQIRDMGIKNPTIVEYPGNEELLAALRSNDVDFVIMDSPTALYWEANSSREFVVIGKPYMYGYGFGIAVNKTERNLLNQINRALLQFETSEGYKQAYKSYLSEF